MAEHSGAGDALTDLLTAREYPLGLRRQALRSIAQLRDGGSHVIELARTGKLARGSQERGDHPLAYLA